MIDLSVREASLRRGVARARERGVIIPTLSQMRDPSLIPSTVIDRLENVGLWDVDPVNLFRINWHNTPTEHGGGYSGVNYVEYPRELTGIDARIVSLVGKWFPTGTHKVGAAFGCLVPRLVTGQYDPTSQRAAWPSTGNYCRGGAYDSALLGCDSIAILPEGMSRERFEWLETVAGEIITTPGSESNVKEIFDKCWELRASGQDIVIFNQFDEFGNYLWHYSVTGAAMAEAFEAVAQPGDSLRGLFLTTGSAGTIASGDYLKQKYPGMQIIAGEALQCPTLLNNGYGAHRIEGIGDKHVPWIHNVKNTDVVAAIDDEGPLSLIRVFNEGAGQEYLASIGVSDDLIKRLPELGISSVANMLGAIKFAKLNNLGKNDVVLTVATDSIEMYRSRLAELNAERGAYTTSQAAEDYERWMLGENADNMLELGEMERRRIHNLKYFTWVEQQGKSVEDLEAQWSQEDYWTSIQACFEPVDNAIREFNALVARD